MIFSTVKNNNSYFILVIQNQLFLCAKVVIYLIITNTMQIEMYIRETVACGLLIINNS
jgi:hypothetical protein